MKILPIQSKSLSFWAALWLPRRNDSQDSLDSLDDEADNADGGENATRVTLFQRAFGQIMERAEESFQADSGGWMVGWWDGGMGIHITKWAP